MKSLYVFLLVLWITEGSYKYAQYEDLSFEYENAMDLYEAQKTEEAKFLFDKIVHLSKLGDSEYFRSNMNLGVIYMHEGNFEKAEEHFLSALEDEHNPNLAYAHKEFAKCLEKSGKHKQARNHWRKLLKFVNDDASKAHAHSEIGQSFFIHGGNYKRARKHFEKSVHLQPGNNAFRMLLANALMYLKDFKSARKHLKIAAKTMDEAKDLLSFIDESIHESLDSGLNLDLTFEIFESNEKKPPQVVEFHQRKKKSEL